MKLLDTLFSLGESLRARFTINRYVFLVLTLGLAFLLQFLLNFFLKRDIYGLLVIAAFLSAWYGGFLPGMIATVIGLLLADYFFIEPKYKIFQTLPETVRVIIFFVQGTLFSLLSESRKREKEERDRAYSAEQKAREIAEQALNHRDEFISMASHELKSPITSQKAFLQLTQKLVNKKEYTQLERYLNRIEEQTNKLASLINQLLDIAKIRVGKMELDFSSFDLKACIRSVAEEMRVRGTRHKIIIRGKTTRDVYADKEKIAQVITNLLSNAIKYSPKAKTVLITLAQNTRTSTVSIQDYGIGISKENQKNLFSKYFRAEGTSEKQFKGFGMGLFIVSEIIKLHHGKIWVKSIKGRGTTFSFTLSRRKVKTN